MKLVADAFAKVNRSLLVLGRRPDGFHELDTVFQAVGLADRLTFEESDGLTLEVDDPSIPSGSENLVLRAARALGEAARVKPETSPATHTGPIARSIARRALETNSPTGSTDVPPGDAIAMGPVIVNLRGTADASRLVRQVSRTIALRRVDPRNGRSRPARPKRAKVLTAEALCKPLTRRRFRAAKVWASQTKPRRPHDLARECTRYAHRYPQDLWTTLRPHAPAPPGMRCGTRDSGASACLHSGGGPRCGAAPVRMDAGRILSMNKTQ